MAEAYRSQYGSDFISVMPTNLYGPGDNYHPELSHVVAALIRRFHEAKLSGARNVVVWGTGTPRREFLYVDDLADACLHLMKTYSEAELVNIAPEKTSRSPSLPAWWPRPQALAATISFDPSRPDGTPRKLLDVNRLAKLGLARQHAAGGRHPARLPGVFERAQAGGGVKFPERTVYIVAHRVLAFLTSAGRTRTAMVHTSRFSRCGFWLLAALAFCGVATPPAAADPAEEARAINGTSSNSTARSSLEMRKIWQSGGSRLRWRRRRQGLLHEPVQ